MTDMHENSLDAYASLNLTKRQKEVTTAFLRVFQNEGATDLAIAGLLKWPINRVTGRIRELTDMGVLEEAGKKVGKYGKMVRVSRIKPKDTLF